LSRRGARIKSEVIRRFWLLRGALIVPLTILFGTAAAFLLTFTLHGSFQLYWSVHSPVNAESIAAVAFVLLILMRASAARTERHVSARFEFMPAGAITLCAVLAFLPTVAAPLLHDSYTHVYEALHESWAQVLETFAPRGGAFLRPIGYISYYMDGKWAGADPFRWHLGNVVLHAINSCLAYWLLRRLTKDRWIAVMAGLVFALHGSRPEAVAWVAARYDLLAALFVLAALLAVDAYAETNRRSWYVPMILSAIAAVLSKESAYALPLLAAVMAIFKEDPARRRTLYAAAAIGATYVLALLYRLRVLGDVGGYRVAPGQAEVLRFNALHSAKALFFREWALLFFPLNWSAEIGIWVKFAVVLVLLALTALLAWSRIERRLLAGAILWVLAASLPVQHLLLLGPDLAGARVLYLPVLGLALLFGLMVAGVPAGVKRWSVAAALILFQLVALLHNEAIWRETAFASQRACRAAGEEIARDPQVVFRGLPVTRNGVFFLANGFPYCVEMNSHVKADQARVLAGNQPAAKGQRVLEWSEQGQEWQPALHPQ